MAYIVYEYDDRNEYAKRCFYKGFYVFQGEKYAELDILEEAKVYRKAEKQMIDICKKLDKKFVNTSGYFKYLEIEDIAEYIPKKRGKL